MKKYIQKLQKIKSLCRCCYSKFHFLDYFFKLDQSFYLSVYLFLFLPLSVCLSLSFWTELSSPLNQFQLVPTHPPKQFFLAFFFLPLFFSFIFFLFFFYFFLFPSRLLFIFHGCVSLPLSLRRGHTLSRSSSPKIGPLTLVQTLFNVVLLLYHSKRTQIFKVFKIFKIFEVNHTVQSLKFE